MPLDGIGYREQELQQAKGTKFISEDAKGVAWASFGGGTNIFIRSAFLHDDPQSNVILMKSLDMDLTVQASRLTEDDVFNSNVVAGFITYRMPSVEKLLNLPSKILEKYPTMTFVVSVLTMDEVFGEVIHVCSNENYCKISFKKVYTPVIYYLSPPVVYYESETYIHFDQKQTTNLIVDLATDEMPFINAKIGGVLMDFENSVDYDTNIV